MTQVGFKTDKGKKRGSNEDSLFIMAEQNIFIVADGVGGHNSGKLASLTAVNKICDFINSHPIHLVNDEKKLKNYFLQCLREANEVIYNIANTTIENAGMATTAVILYIYDGQAYLVNIGDSRAYIIRDKQISQITEDHTYVNELYKEGKITRAEAEIHPQKNMITRAIGGDENIIPDFFRLKVYKNDILILCTDGLHGEVSSEEICSIATKASSMDDMSSALIDLANSNGGNDNITVICIKI